MLENTQTIIAAFIIILAACADATQTVLMEYLEAKGISWIQVYLFSEFVVGIVVILVWIISFSYNYIYYKCNNTNMDIKFFVSSYAYYGDVTYYNYIMSIFPDVLPLTECYKQWIALVIRTLLGLLLNVFLVASLLYCESGTMLLIETLTMTVATIVLGWTFFDEPIGKYVYSAFGICIIGIILVIQPDFIFNSGASDSDNCSWKGVVLTLCAGLTHGIMFSTVKWTNRLNVSWASTVVVIKLIGTILLVIVFAVCEEYLNLQLISKYNLVEINGIYIYTFMLISTGLLLLTYVVLSTIAYQIGHIGRLSIIGNINIIIAYLLQSWWLNQTNNYICYIGVCITIFGCIVVFLEQYKVRMRQTHSDESNLCQTIPDLERQPLLQS